MKKDSKSRKRVEIDMKEILHCVQKFTDFTKLSQKEIAHGSYGHLFIVCDGFEKDEKHCKKIVKIVIDGPPEIIAKEIAISQILQDSGLTPKLYNVFHCKKYLFIIMDRYDTNLQVTASELFHDFQGPLRALEGDTFPWTHLVFREDDVMEMFRIAYELGNKYDVIHGDLKPDQFLWRKSDEKIVVTDFGYAGTSDGLIPALRGWTWLGHCGHKQRLPPDADDAVVTKMYRAYFNMYQLWTNLACRPTTTTAILLRNGISFGYLSSQIYPFAKGHRFHIPGSVITIMKMEENKFHETLIGGDAALSKIIRECRGITLPETAHFPATIRPFLLTN